MLLPRHLLAVGTVVALLTGCSDADESLPAADLEQALLTVDNLGTDWVQQPDTGETTDGPEGTGTDCLDDAGELESIEPVEKASATFTWTAGTLSIANGIGAYEDPEQVSTQFDEAFANLEDCTEVSNQTKTATMEAEISTDRVASTDAVDQQINVEALGTYTAGDQSQDFAILITLAQVGANVTTVQTVGTSGEISTAHATYVEIAVDRLAAVTDGEEPPETVAPSPDLG